ncbi:fumarylacetoacetate hydrolase family protein [Parasphingorhabdus pacifica]
MLNSGGLSTGAAVRDHKQWLLGKSLDTHCPMGPYAVSADEIADVAALELETTANGASRQLALVKDLIFDIPDLISKNCQTSPPLCSP